MQTNKFSSDGIKKQTVATAFCILLILPFQTMAWGVLGHRIVGGIAEKNLTHKTRKHIHSLLGNETIAMVSNWADLIKSDSSYRYLDIWHYINLPSGLTENELQDYLRKDTATDLYTRMQFIVSELRAGNLPREQEVFYLKLLIHFVGDAHQPMHTARKEDRGGNDIRVSWFNTPTNLHRVWDEQLIEFQQLSYTEYIDAIHYCTKEEKKRWQGQPMEQWIQESYLIAEQLYRYTKPGDKLSYRYNYDHVNVLNAQLLKGGIRLAALLNDIYG